MSISLKANAAGTQGEILLNGNPVEVVTASGVQFCKNKLFNGEVTRINQRAFNGTWSGKNTWETQAATIAAKETSYGYDMWFRSNAARSDGSAGSDNMAQWIEAGNFRPSTVHTLSGTGVTTYQITSPASGDWKIVVAQGATNVQVEEGSVATPFEIRPVSFELAQCQRYYETGTVQYIGYSSAGLQIGGWTSYATNKRTTSVVTLYGTPEENTNLGSQTITPRVNGFRLHSSAVASSAAWYTNIFYASAVI